MSQESWRSAVLRDLGQQPSAGALAEHSAGQTAARPAAHGADTAPVRPPAPPAGPPPPAAGLEPPALADPPRYGDPPARRVLRSLRLLVGTPGEDRELAEAAEATRRPVTTGRRVAVAGVCAGAGSTTLAALLACVYAARRQDRVLAVDTGPDGSLARRLVAAGSDGQVQPADLGALPRSPAGPWVLPPVAGDPLLGGPVGGLGRLFAVSVADVGDLHRPRAQVVLADAHAVVLVAPATSDGAHRARLALDALAEGRGVEGPPSACVVLVSLTPSRRGLEARRAARALRRQGAPCLVLPYDRHLAAAAGVDPAWVGQAAVRVGTRVAGLALSVAAGR